MRIVLLIDDEPAMETLVRMALSGTGVRVVRAGNSEQALQAARAARPAVVLLDLALNGEDGLAILPTLRREAALLGVPIVAFTVHSSREREARELGVDAFVSKPFEVEQLRQVVEEFLS